MMALRPGLPSGAVIDVSMKMSAKDDDRAWLAKYEGKGVLVDAADV